MLKRELFKMSRAAIWTMYKNQRALIRVLKDRVLSTEDYAASVEYESKRNIKQKVAAENAELISKVYDLEREVEFLKGRLGELHPSEQAIFNMQVPKPESPLFYT